MVLKVHTYVSCLSEPKARSRLGVYFFMGINPLRTMDNNGMVTINANMIHDVVSSVAEAEYTGSFTNVKTVLPMRIAFAEMGHQQPTTPTIYYNTTTVGLGNHTIRQRFSKAANMRYHYVQD